MLRDELTTELHPLIQNKFIIHEPHLISGTQIAGGLAPSGTLLLYAQKLRRYKLGGIH